MTTSRVQSGDPNAMGPISYLIVEFPGSKMTGEGFPILVDLVDRGLMAIGAGMGALTGKLGKTSIDKQFQDQVHDMVQPGTSALFLMLEKVTPDKAVEAMSKYGGTVLKTSLSKDDEKELQEALHGQEATQ